MLPVSEIILMMEMETRSAVVYAREGNYAGAKRALGNALRRLEEAKKAAKPRKG